MTDFTRVNNVYYDMNVYNPLSTQIPAEIDNKLLFPLLNTSDNYSVAVAKAKIPLDSVPLTKSNIGLKLYQLGLKIGTTEELAYVRQVNANQDNFVWNCPPGSKVITKYKYTSTGVLTQVAEQDISIYVNNVYNFVVDDYSNLFVIGSNVGSELINKLYVIDENNNLLQTDEFVNLTHVYIDRGQNLYLCDDAPNPAVYIYGMSNQIGLVSMTLKTTLTANRAGNPLSNLLFCVADNEIIVGYNQNTITIYNALYEPQTDIQETAITQLQNLANINSTANTYILSNKDELDDTLIGVKSNIPYNVNTGQQISVGSINSPLAILPSITPTHGGAFGVGTDGYTYYLDPYPPTSYPAQTWFNANNSQPLKAGVLWSAQRRQEDYYMSLYSMSNLNAFYVWQFTDTPVNPQEPRTWVSVGEIDINLPTVTAISIDRQAGTRKLLAVGSDNNLYQSQDPVGSIEFFVGSGQPPFADYIYGLDEGTELGTQQNFVSHNLGNLFGSHETMMKHQNRFFVGEYQGQTSDINLVIYSIKDFSVVDTILNFSANGVTLLTPLPLASKFVWLNNTNDNVVYVNNISTYATVETITYFKDNSLQPPTAFYELNATHFAIVNNTNNIYIFQHLTATPIAVLSMPNSLVVLDLCVSQSNIVNGATTLYVATNTITQIVTLATEIHSITFTDNTYSAISSTSLIYAVANDPSALNKNITFLDYEQDQQSIMFIVANYDNNGNYTNKVLYTLFNIVNYALADALKSVLTYTSSEFKYPPNKSQFVLFQSTTATHRWSQITSNISPKAINVSRTAINSLYAINNADSKIYKGTLTGTSITFQIMSAFSGTAYDYVSSTKNDNPTISSTLFLYGITSQNLITQLSLGDECGEIARNDVNSTYLVSYKANQKLQALSATTLSSLFNVSLTGSYRLFVKNGSDIDAGKVDIFDMAVFINSINSAFQEATTKINQALGSGTLTSAPSLTLDYLTGLCTLTYPQAFTQSANGILFNKNLLNLVYYQSTLDPTSGLYQLLLNTQQESTTQQTKSIYNFNQLDKILFQSNCIYVVGAYFGKNQSNNIITDIDVVIGDYIENLGQTLYFQPNFLRTYALQSNLPLERIQLNILYQYRDGSEYQLYINQGQNVTTKLQMIRKF
jgi:hypothetical protein